MNLLSHFTEQCQRSPTQLACTEIDRALSYAQFNHAQQRLAAVLQQHECATHCIGVFLDRGIDAAIAIYAILSAGACYLPLDLKNPPERLHFIVQDAKPRLILGQGPCPAWLPTSELWLDITRLASPATDSINSINSKSINANAIAAILYTSGSTGTPKGVALSHRAMLNFADWASITFALTAHDRIASLAPFHFDLSVFDLFSSLASGASVHFMPAHLTLTPSRLSQWLQTQAISCWYTVPSLLSFLALKGNLSEHTLPALRTLLFAGEVFATPALISLATQLPHVQLYNLYGPTETNVCCYWPVERSRLKPEHAIPIGLPAAGAELQIDPDTGELSINSLNNFAGYWQQGALQPLASYPWYASGDKVSRNEWGEYCYHGRLDRMLKCSGYRVEPAEIEQVLRQAPAVDDCAVIGIPDPTGGQRPAAVVILQKNHSLAELVPWLKVRLPQYMQPAKFAIQNRLPRLSNGKIDYVSLTTLFENV